MQKFWWPGYEMQLVGELQRQQNSSQFCDTLLQTEGISVPTHSCVLAALSPYLCQRLSASPSPPSGQKRRLQLQTVTSQALLKLVGLLYSGELEVRGNKEQNDVLAAAHQLGIGHLVLGDKDGWVKGGDLLNGRHSVGKQTENGIHAEETRQRSRGLRTQDEQVQTEMNGKRENDPRVEKKCFVSVATQTLKAGVSSGISSASDQTLECPSPIPLQPQSLTPSEQLIQSVVGQPSISETNTTSISTLSASFSDDPSSPRFQEENISKLPSEAGDVTFVLNDDETRQENREANGPMTEDGGSAGQLRDEKTPEGKRHAGGKSFENMKRMETTQISVKMTLRRTTESKAWRVVSEQHEDETPSPLTTENQTRQMDQTSASSVLPVQDTETPNLHPVLATSPQTPKHDGKNSEPQSDVNLEPLPQPQGSVEGPDPDPVPDPETSRMLDEVLVSLNLLPSLNDGCETPQTSHDGGQNFCQVLENRAGPADEYACDFYKSFRMQSVHSSADGDTFYDSVAEDESMYPQTTGSILPSTCVLREPKLHFLGSQPLSSQEDRSVLHFLPLSREDEPQPEQFFSSCLNELRLPRPLSPLEPRSPEAQQPPPNKSFTLPENHVQQSSLKPTWFTGTPWSLHFPLLHTLTEDKSKSLPQVRQPNNGDTCAETVCDTKEGRNKSQPEEKSDSRKTKKRKRVATEDAAALKKRRRKCISVLQDPLAQYLECKTPTSCSVSLSSNSVSAAERKTDANDSNSTWTSLDKTKRTSVEENPRMGGKGTEQTPIRTRSFMKSSQEKKSDKVPKKSVLTPVVCKTKAKMKQGIVVTKRRRGRPRKIKLDPLSPEDWNCSEVGDQQASPKLEARDGGRKRRRKARKHPSEAEKTKSDERAGENAAAKDPETRKQSLMTTLKEFQKFLKRQRKDSTESQSKERVEEKRDAANGSNSEAEVEIKESVKIQDPDKNHNFFLTSAAAQWNKSNQDDANSSTGQKMSFNGDNLPSDDAVGVTEPSCDPQQLLKNEGVSCWTGGSEAGPSVISDDASSHIDAKLPETTREASSQRTGPPSSGANGLSVTPHRDREEDDQEEVDVLLVSPGKLLPGGAREESMKKLEVIPDDEEEEEDVNEIDVTGDEEE